MRQLITNLSSIVFAICFSSALFAQTPGTLTFTFTQVAHSPCYSASKNLMAVWIQTSAGGFVKTKLRNVGSVTKDHLPTWAVNSGGISSNAISTSCNVTDATTGATLTSFGTKTIVWDGKNVSGSVNGVTVADGVYKVTIQSTWNHGTGSTATQSYSFTKGPTAQHLTPVDNTNFTGVTLDWVPTATGIDENADELGVNIYPNPTLGVFTVDFKKATSIQVVNILGSTVYTEKVEEGILTKSIDLANFANGIYFVCVFDEDRSSKHKLILNK